jgi:hypothetical protein
MAEPHGPAPKFDNSMRCCGHFGQPGRSIAEICAADTGLNSGIVHRADLDSCSQKADQPNQIMALPAPGAVVKIAQIEKLHLRRVNQPGCGP